MDAQHRRTVVRVRLLANSGSVRQAKASDAAAQLLVAQEKATKAISAEGKQPAE